MRDRREVLRLLAGGTVVAAGASLVTTSTVFAETGTVSCLPTQSSMPTDIRDAVSVSGVVQDNSQNDYVTASIDVSQASLANALCPSGYSKSYQYRWSISGETGTSPRIVSDATPTTVYTANWQTVNDARNVRIVNTGQTLWLASGSYTLTLQLRIVCSRSSPARTCWRCVGYQAQFTWVRSGNNGTSGNNGDGFSAGPTEAPGVVATPNCDD